MYKKCMQSPVGEIVIIEDKGKIVEIDIAKNNKLDNIEEKDTELLLQTEKQLKEYFEGKRFDFEIPLNPIGTEFMQSVWKALEQIPYGETRTYKEIADAVGNPKASRAVGMANHRNPIPIIIPCHRVVGKSGSLTGYAGGIDKKVKLLELEGVDMSKFFIPKKEIY